MRPAPASRLPRLSGQAAAVVLATLAACVPALRKPPDLMDLAGGGKPPQASEAQGLLERAAALYARRDPESVRTAVGAFVRATAADPARVEGLIGAVQAGVWLSDHEEDAAARERVATAAVQAAQWCGKLAPESAACTYWLGAALGVQARERHATGLSALPKIEEAFVQAAQRIPEYEEAGPDRALALLYVRAPGWPTGPGDPDLGLEHARKAAELRPDYPPNQLALGEALAATDDPDGSREAYSRALELARARAAAGDPDAAEWAAEAEKALGPSAPR